MNEIEKKIYWKGFEDGMQSAFKHMKIVARSCERAHNKKNRLIGR